MLPGARNARPGRAAQVVLALGLTALLAGCGSSGGGPSTTSAGTTAASTATTPTSTTAQPGPNGPGAGQVVDGIPCESTEQLTYHVHSHIWLLRDGQPEALPAEIGIIIPAQCLYYLHTHDTTGVIHVEAPAARGFTLGEFFDIWGQPLSPTSAANLTGKLHVFVGSKAFTGNPRDIPLKSHQLITIEQGKLVPPPQFTFSAGL